MCVALMHKPNDDPFNDARNMEFIGVLSQLKCLGTDPEMNHAADTLLRSPMVLQQPLVIANNAAIIALNEFNTVKV